MTEPAPAPADLDDDETSIFSGTEDTGSQTSVYLELPEPFDHSSRLSEGLDPTVAKRRADIDAKQIKVAQLLEEMECEGVVLLMPAHVAWFTGGMNVRGLIADGERPGIYTNGRQRWLLASNIDAPRLFDEELDGLGFQLKEWQWSIGRAVLLGELVAGKRFATDRPFPNMPLVNDRLRLELRPLTDYEQSLYHGLGRAVVHAVEATARSLERGESEREIAGHLAHRLYRHGVEATAISIAADERARRFRRAGFTETPVETTCYLQATGCRDGLYVTVGRTVCFGPPNDKLRQEFDLAAKMAAIFRAMSVPGETVGSATEAARKLVIDTPHEYEWRFSQPGYGAGRFPVEELRKAGQDEKFALGWPLVWQTKIGQAAIVDTVIVDQYSSMPATPPEVWPFKRVKLREQYIDVPDILMREG
ncbi:MAG: M24 family metallopeptidase [Gemmataceae bacterium]|nr:M24 family metallopeptidase [Gemmataceae bacterium]